MADTLLVPMEVTALCVGADDVNGTSEAPWGTVHFAGLAPDFSRMPWVARTEGSSVVENDGPNVGAAVERALFQEASPPLEQGVHVHWVLPAALAHGVTDDQGAVRFRAAPNRWLVVRLASDRGDPSAPRHHRRAWIVESDRLWDASGEDDPLPTNALSRAVPLNPPPDPESIPNRPFLNVGRVFPWEGWSEDPKAPRMRPFTAVGYGALTYAAYAHAPNVFGMYDPLEDVDTALWPPATTRISYLVVGWYADPGADPLAGLALPLDGTPGDVVAVVEEALGWTFDPGEGEASPRRTVCHGLLRDISWDPRHTRYVRPPGKAPVAVAVGNSTAEALSALLAHRVLPRHLQQGEQVLNAVQLGLLHRLAHPDGLFEMEEALHQSAFAASHGGTVWAVRPRLPEGEALSAPGDGADTALPEELAGDLNHLNVLQKRHDALVREVAALRSQVFADWHRYLVLEYPGATPPSDLLDADDAFHYLRYTVIPALDGLVDRDLPGLEARLREQVERVEGALDPDLVLTPTPGPRFWRPADPVVLLAGEDLLARYRRRGGQSPGEGGHLRCRLPSALITRMEVASGLFTVRTGDLPGIPDPAAPPDAAVADVLGGLVGEAFFLDPDQAWILAHAAAGADPGELWKDIREAQESLFEQGGGGGVTFHGTLPAPLAVSPWAAPWLPLALEWEVELYPLRDGNLDGGAERYGQRFIADRFSLEDAIELVDPGPFPERLPPMEVYRGSAVLAHGAEVNIRSQIDRFLHDFPDDPAAAELRAIRADLEFSMMAQALGGFHQALVMRRQTLQLAVADPLAVLSGALRSRFSNVTVKGAVGEENTLAPVPEGGYNPLRAGFLRLRRLWIVDAFGQKREVAPAPGEVVRAGSLTPRLDDPGRSLMALPPRLSQPARLYFRWLSAADDQVEMNSHPASSPVFGWVLFNHLDRSLMIFDAGGNALGSLSARGPVWQGAPGSDQTFDRPIDDVFADANPRLRDFALGVHGHPEAGRFVADLLAAIDRTVTLIQPGGGDPSLPVLLGRPLALVRASLGLELEGPPALDQSWRAFAAAVEADSPGEDRDAAGFPDVAVPVRLGDLAKIDDGLVGYFVDVGGPDAYRTFYAAGAAGGGSVVPPRADRLLVRGRPGAEPLVVSMLVDPRAPVHATTGLLPVKQIRIPPDMYGEALRSLAATFLATPVLTPVAHLALPVARQGGFRWSWVERGADGWSEGPIAEIDPNATTFTPQRIAEGWLKLNRDDAPPDEPAGP